MPFPYLTVSDKSMKEKDIKVIELFYADEIVIFDVILSAIQSGDQALATDTHCQFLSVCCVYRFFQYDRLISIDQAKTLNTVLIFGHNYIQAILLHMRKKLLNRQVEQKKHFSIQLRLEEENNQRFCLVRLLLFQLDHAFCFNYNNHRVRKQKKTL